MITARQRFKGASVHGKGEANAIRMVGFALLDIADAIREHTAAMPPAPRNVGRCTEVLNSVLVDLHGGPDERMPTPCSLDHGHTGAHFNDEHGTTWTDAPQTPAPSEPAADDHTRDRGIHHPTPVNRDPK